MWSVFFVAATLQVVVYTTFACSCLPLKTSALCGDDAVALVRIISSNCTTSEKDCQTGDRIFNFEVLDKLDFFNPFPLQWQGDVTRRKFPKFVITTAGSTARCGLSKDQFQPGVLYFIGVRGDDNSMEVNSCRFFQRWAGDDLALEKKQIAELVKSRCDEIVE